MHVRVGEPAALRRNMASREFNSINFHEYITTTMDGPKVYRSEEYNCHINELMFHVGKGMSKRSKLIPCII